MEPVPGSPVGRVSRLDAVLVLLVVALGIGSLLVWLGPSVPGVSDARALDIAINVAATIVGAAVAILAWVRWRETRGTAALYESSAFVALSTVNATIFGIVVTDKELEFGLSPTNPGKAAVYVWTLVRLAAAVLLVIGATRSLRRQRPPLPPLVVAVGPTIIILVSAVMLFALEAALPPVPSVTTLDPTSVRPLAGPAEATALAVIQVAIFALFILAAVLFRRLFLRDRHISHAYLAVGLVAAAFSQLHFGLEPVVVTGNVTSTDALRLFFYTVLFMGFHAELEADLGALRRANGELRRMGEVEAANATLAERSRLAREIHDGLAQDLWYAKLKQGRLAQDESLDEGLRTTVREVLGAIDAALAEARQAVMAMRADPASGTLGDVLHAYVNDFADRFGVRADFRADVNLDRLPPKTEAEVLRIVQEALNNVRRHADATVVRVRAERIDGRVRVTIADNGRGFDLENVPADRYGLRGMRERAAQVGAILEIDARPADGTRVAVEVPAPERRM